MPILVDKHACSNCVVLSEVCSKLMNSIKKWRYEFAVLIRLLWWQPISTMCVPISAGAFVITLLVSLENRTVLLLTLKYIPKVLPLAPLFD